MLSPFLGGSTIAVSNLYPSSINLDINDASPRKNSALSILLFFAFSLAFSTAGATISIPTTFLTFFARESPISPAPQ